MTFTLSLSLPFSPEEVLSSEQDGFNEKIKETFKLIEIEEEEDFEDEDGSYSGTRVLISSSESKGNILKFLVDLKEFHFDEISNLMDQVEEYS